jgi:hypothetical protein
VTKERVDQAIRLAQQAADYLYEDDPDFVEAGCSDVSQVIAELLQRRGFSVERVYGWAKKGKRGEPFMHAWLTIEGEHFDPTLWVQGRKLDQYQYKVEPGTQVALESPDDMSYYVDELDEAL